MHIFQIQIFNYAPYNKIGIGVPAVAVSGANAANTIVNVVEHVVNLIKN